MYYTKKVLHQVIRAVDHVPNDILSSAAAFYTTKYLPPIIDHLNSTAYQIVNTLANNPHVAFMALGVLTSFYMHIPRCAACIKMRN